MIQKLRSLVTWKNISRGLIIYFLMLFFFEVCYYHTMGRLAKGFVLGIGEFFWSFYNEKPFVCIIRLLTLAFCGMLETIGMGIALTVCKKLNLKGIVPFVVSVIFIVGFSFLIVPFMSFAKWIWSTVGILMLIGYIILVMSLGSVGSFFVISGLTDTSASKDERQGRVALGFLWRHIK